MTSIKVNESLCGNKTAIDQRQNSEKGIVLKSSSPVKKKKVVRQLRSVTQNYTNFELMDKMRSTTQIKNHNENTSIDSQTRDEIKETIESKSSATDDEANVIYSENQKRKISNLKLQMSLDKFEVADKSSVPLIDDAYLKKLTSPQYVMSHKITDFNFKNINKSKSKQ